MPDNFGLKIGIEGEKELKKSSLRHTLSNALSNAMPPTTEQAVIMLASNFYERQGRQHRRILRR